MTHYPPAIGGWCRQWTDGTPTFSKLPSYSNWPRTNITPNFKAEFENLALAYLRLAEQAKQKDYLEIDSETPLLKQDGGSANDG